MSHPPSIGPFQIVELLGRGGAGSVYRARHDRTGEVVALKTLERPWEAFLPTIRRETQALARLRHPGIARIVQSGSENGVPWYAMELVDGPSLRGLGGAPRTDCLTVLRRLCHALAYLHGEGIVHRDLTPDNVLVRPGLQPVLVDFGVVARVGAELSREALDIEDSISGTLAYMAPEQLRGELLDARADLYALGCILYEILTGQPPFSGLKSSALARAHLNESPLPPSHLASDVPEALDLLVLRLLAKEPSRRLGHADDVGAALAAIGAENGLPPDAPRPRPYLYRPAFVGRDGPMEVLQAHLKRLQKGFGGLMLLEGESGVGKTRLALEFARLAERRRVRVLTGEIQPFRVSSPLQSLRQPLQSIADRCRARGREETERLLGRRAKLLALYEPAFRGLPGQEAHPEPVDLPAAAAMLRLFAGLFDTFAALAEDSPVLLVLDDLQWADELTLSWLEYLSFGERLNTTPLLVAGTYRSEEMSEGLRRLLESPWTSRVALSGLDEKSVSSMAGAMLAVEPPPENLARYLTRRSEGNPFFVAEYLRVGVAVGVFYRDESGRWQVAEPSESPATEALFESLPLPASLQELVRRRLDSLGFDARQVVEVASVLGREVDEALLGAVTRLPEPLLTEAVKELVPRQILEDADAGRLRFVHDQIRDVAYELIPEILRRQLHHAAAEALEVGHSQESMEDVAALGHHWERAGAAERARPYYLAAARQARSRFALADAERLYRSYLTLASEPSSETGAALNELARDVLFVRGRRQEATECSRRALDLATALQDPALEATSLRNLGIIEAEMGDAIQAQALLQRALAIQGNLGDRISEADLMINLSYCKQCLGQLEEAFKPLQEASQIYRSLGHRSGEIRVLEHQGVLHAIRGAMEEANECFLQCLSLSRSSGNLRWEGTALGNLANVLDLQEEAEAAATLYEQAIAIHREIGDVRNQALAVQNLADLYARQGVPDRALAGWEQAAALLRQVGRPRDLASVQVLQATLERRLARFDVARQHLEEAGEALNGVRSHVRVEFLCERGHQSLAEGESARTWHAAACELADQLGLGTQSTSGQLLSQLRRAVEADEAGRRLFRGECADDIPAGLRRWLIQTGQMNGSTD